jgi:cardiolipin synthase C
MRYWFLYLLGPILFISCSGKHAGKLIKSSACDTLRPMPILEDLAGRLNEKSAVYTLESGGQSLFARAWLWQNAKKQIDIQHYIFKKDNTGRIACHYLLRAADRGVRIRLLLDEVAVKKGAADMALLDSHENIEVKVYNPGFRYSKSLGYRLKMLFTQMKRLNQRMHIKTITVDNKVSIMGGRNVADEYFDYDHRYNFRDRDIVMLGKLCENVTGTFNQHWTDTLSINLDELVNENKKKYNDPKRFERFHRHACDPKNLSSGVRNKINQYPVMFDTIKSKELVWTNDVQFVADEPGKNGNRQDRKGGVCTDSVMALLRQAKKTVIIQSPYIILNDQGKELFKELLDRGVKIKILTNSMGSTDNFEAFSGYKRDRKMILEMGIDIYEFKPSPEEKYSIMIPDEQEKIKYKAVFGLHSKSIIIDEAIAVVGTYNIDPRSADLNTECIAIVRSKQFADKIMKYINLEFEPGNSWHVTKNYNPDKEAGLWKRWKVASRRGVPKSIL